MRLALLPICAALGLFAAPLEGAPDDADNSADDPSAARIEVPDAGIHHMGAKPWTSLKTLDRKERFRFAVMADRTGGERPGVFPRGVTAVNLVQPDFVVGVGDYVSGWKGDAANLNAQWDRFLGEVSEIEAPFFYVPGNHDVQNAGSEAIWNERFGRTYYHFTYKRTLFIVLNSEFIAHYDVTPEDLADDPKGKSAWRASEHVSEQREAMLDYLARVLDQNEDARWTFVFMHQGLWRGDWHWPPKDAETGERDFSGYPMEGPYLRIDHDENPYWQRIEQLLADRDYTFFAGHNHDYAYVDASDERHRHDRITMATTGGSSKLRGPSYGEFDHFMWVTMTEEGPVFANLLLDGVQPKDLPIPDNRPPFVD